MRLGIRRKRLFALELRKKSEALAHAASKPPPEAINGAA
jgi:hypothetical protein